MAPSGGWFNTFNNTVIFWPTQLYPLPTSHVAAAIAPFTLRCKHKTSKHGTVQILKV